MAHLTKVKRTQIEITQTEELIATDCLVLPSISIEKAAEPNSEKLKSMAAKFALFCSIAWEFLKGLLK